MTKIKNTVNVVYAEDDPDDQFMLKEAWKENKILNNLHIVDNGLELLEYLKNEGKYRDTEKYPLPGLILLDLNMPRMNGREAIVEIKKVEKLKNIPIIVFTTSKLDEDVIKSYNLGVSSFITKPLSFDSLVKVLGIFNNYWLEIVHLP